MRVDLLVVEVLHCEYHVNREVLPPLEIGISLYVSLLVVLILADFDLEAYILERELVLEAVNEVLNYFLEGDIRILLTLQFDLNDLPHFIEGHQLSLTLGPELKESLSNRGFLEKSMFLRLLLEIGPDIHKAICY
jgi:hypothetical protein